MATTNICIDDSYPMLISTQLPSVDTDEERHETCNDKVDDMLLVEAGGVTMRPDFIVIECS